MRLLHPVVYARAGHSGLHLSLCMAHFPRRFQYFASRANTRYEWVRSGPIGRRRTAKGPFRYDPFVLSDHFCNIKPKYVNMADIN